MKKKYLILVVMVLAALMLTACVTDNDNSATEGNVSVSVSVTDPVGVGASRAITAANENTISNLHILAFNNETGVMLSNGYTEVDNLSNITCKLAIAGVQETQVAIYAIANLGNPTVFDDHSLTLSQFENMYVKAADADGSTQGSFSLYKAGDETPVATVTNETHALMISNKAIKRLALAGVGFKLNLVRLVPKFVLNLYGNDVQLLSYRFVNMPVGDYLVGHDEDMTGTEYQSSTKVDLGSTALAENISYYGFKSYNAPISSSIITNQRDRIEGKAPATAAYLEVTACKATEPSLVYYYRIYLGGVDADGNLDATQFNILRNHNYNLNIVFSSYIIDDYRAGINGDVNATIEVTPWATETRDVADLNIISVERPVNIGDYLFSDGSWGSYTPGTASVLRHPIAVIFSNTTSLTDQAAGYSRGYAVALASCGAQLKWAAEGAIGVNTQVHPTLTNSLELAKANLDGRTETNRIKTLSDFSKENYPSAYYATHFGTSEIGLTTGIEKVSTEASGGSTGYAAPAGTSGWFLGSIGQYYLVAKNLGGNLDNGTESTWGTNNVDNWWISGISEVNKNNVVAYFTAASNNWATSFEIPWEADNFSTWYWCSSETSAGNAFYILWSGDGGFGLNGRHAKSETHGDNRGVRPVIAF
jgi:hypothetical protein